MPDVELVSGSSEPVEVVSYFVDPDDDVLAYSVASSDTAVVTAAASADEGAVTVTGGGEGAATVTVTATDPDGLSAQQGFRVTVLAEGSLAIASLRPEVLIEGDEVTISGSGFSAAAEQNRVEIDGLEASVLSATPTQLVALVPESDCLPPRSTELSIAVEGSSVSTPVDIWPRPADWFEYERQLVVKWWRPGAGCLAALPGTGGGSRFAVGVVNLSEDPSSLAPIRLSVASGPPSVAVPAANVVADRAPARGMPARLPGKAHRQREISAAEVRPVAEGGAPLRTSGGVPRLTPGAPGPAPGPLGSVPMAGPPARAAPGSAQGPTRSTLRTARTALGGLGSGPMAGFAARWASGPAHGAARPALGALGSGSIGGLTARRTSGSAPAAARPAAGGRRYAANDTIALFASPVTGCVSKPEVRAVVRLDGEGAVWLDDLDNPASFFTDSELEEMDAFYSAHVTPVRDAYFGQPSDVDGNDGRILVLMTKEANRAGVPGWVSPDDLRPASECATSNGAEIIYAHVPDPDGEHGAARTKGDITELSAFRRMLARESAHLIHARNLALGGADYASWEAGGAATLAELLVGLSVNGHAERRGTPPGIGAEEVDADNGWYLPWITGMSLYFGLDPSDATQEGRIPFAPQQCSWMGTESEGNGGPCVNTRATRDVPAMLLFYAMDRFGKAYPGGEEALMRALTESPRRGMAALTDVLSTLIGATAPEDLIQELFADFYVLLWLEIGFGANAIGMESWNLPAIWSQLPPGFQIGTHGEASATFEGEWSVRGGSSLFIDFEPGEERSAAMLKITAQDGSDVSEKVFVWIIRLS